MMNSEDQTISAPILDMLTVANEYCYFLENVEQKKKEQVLMFMQRILPLLYLKGSLLPSIEPEYPEADERFVAEEKWEVLFTNLRGIFGKDDEFMIIDPQYINDTEPLKASISENLADIYQDMKDFLLLPERMLFMTAKNYLPHIGDFELGISWGASILCCTTNLMNSPPFSENTHY